ncbi:hypothetical protein jhhlp_000056 [Lomentospora prolificans]|uniref:DUF2828 domain-containing protein n=1 Tax=Lomentospora prolificans TaxID=41688 RepID=A0A2N3NLF2_9PEZI|nr:hypothetical protein jhhlp_000056 [Lomentospora prolificans]
MTNEDVQSPEPWFLKSGFAVRFPTHPALTMPDDEFIKFIEDEVIAAVVDEDLEKMWLTEAQEDMPSKKGQPFMDALLSRNGPPQLGPNMTLTENQDLTHISTKNPLVDLFYDLESTVQGPRLKELLDAAWTHDPLATLKIIFNARSIHLGKGSRTAFYMAAGWLAKYHPRTLLKNLGWLSRPIIEKKVSKEESTPRQSGEDAMVIVTTEDISSEGDESMAHDVPNGVAHGYWKDLLNLLALSANDLLDVLAQPKDILNITSKGPRVTQEEARERRHKIRDERHSRAIEKFNNDSFHRGLHLSIARLFAAQLKRDLTALHGSDPRAKRSISLCAKWAPSHERFHDRHTIIVSSIAEILHPMPNIQALVDSDPSLTGNPDRQREVYLRHVREEYRKSISALRQHLNVVERNLSAKTYGKIEYDCVPSTAMNRYTDTFIKRDEERFFAYAEDVAGGKSRISGATLLPSTLTKEVLSMGGPLKRNQIERAVRDKITDGQWRALVQRIKDSGSLESSIAVCDVSGSMYSPTLQDGTTPMHSSIGLSLLIAEVAQPPFRGAFITFSEKPEVVEIDLSEPLTEKIKSISQADWGYSTNFVSVFEDLILPMAQRHHLKQDDMVKRVFVFSDMHFDQACSSENALTTSYERIVQKYKEAGYEVPELVFWNLAGGRGGGTPKPVTADENGTTLVSGYSQGMLKVFLDGGGFEDPEAEDSAVAMEETEDGVEIVKVAKEKMDPLVLVKKAISHKAYSMLQVVD